MPYLALKHVHMTAVVLSLALFALRGAWLVMGSPRLEARWVRVVPHVVDTVLLASALALCATLGMWPLVVPWLTAKVALLLLYIALGVVAMRPGRPKRVRVAAWLLAIAVFVSMVSVARAHDPWGALAPFLR